MIKNRAALTSVADFSGFGGNLMKNAEFGSAPSRWSNAGASGSTLWGFNSLSVENARGGTFVADHALSYLDIDRYPWLRGRTVTWVAIGRAETGVALSLRAAVRTAGGSILSYGQSQAFSDTAPSVARVCATIPEAASNSKYLVFRVNVSGASTGDGVGKGGEIAMPMIFLGKDFDALAPRMATDGANTFYGSQTISGGGWELLASGAGRLSSMDRQLRSTAREAGRTGKRHGRNGRRDRELTTLRSKTRMVMPPRVPGDGAGRSTGASAGRRTAAIHRNGHLRQSRTDWI